MQLQKASRKKAKIKCALQGPSGSGKTKSSLLIAYGLCNNWESIAVIDTENRSAELYSDLGPFWVLPVHPPFTPETYIAALGTCIQNGIQVIIIDSLSHEWENLLNYHASLVGNSFTNWSKVTPRHDALVEAILQTNAHIICTIRSKQEYVLSEKNGKQVPEKVGLKGIQRDNLEYEFTIAFELDTSLKAKVSKDRTQLFNGKPDFIPGIETGIRILEWCNAGEEDSRKDDLLTRIRVCPNLDELRLIYDGSGPYQEELLSEFTKRKQQLSQPIT